MSTVIMHENDILILCNITKKKSKLLLFNLLRIVVFGIVKKCAGGIFLSYLLELRASPKADGQERIYTHGEKKVAAVADRMANGIPVNDNTMTEVWDLCNYLKLDFSRYFGNYRPPVKEEIFKGNY